MMGKRYKTFKEYLEHEYCGPYSATDIIIRHNDGEKSGIVLEQRLNDPQGLAFPGGMGERMPLPANAVKEAKEETNLEIVLDDPLRPFLALSGLNDDPREFICTNVYTAQGSGTLQRGSDAKKVYLLTHDEIYVLTQTKNLWSMERQRRIALLYLDHVGYEKAREEANKVRKKIAVEYEVRWRRKN